MVHWTPRDNSRVKKTLICFNLLKKIVSLNYFEIEILKKAQNFHKNPKLSIATLQITFEFTIANRHLSQLSVFVNSMVI